MIFFHILLVISSVSAGFTDNTLRLVNVLYRHGDRSPVVTYPTDPNKEDKWSQGFGWLSKIGMQEQYRLGQWLKARYIDSGFMNNTYRRDEITVHSSDEDRCLMSAYCNLAGLYPPGDTQKFKPDINWQPIPVFTKPKIEDNMLNMGESCPRYDELIKQTLASHAVTEEEKRNKAFYMFVGKMSGTNHEDITNIWKISDASFCEKTHNLTLPSWINNTVYEKLIELGEYQFTLLFNNREMSMLKGGPLLKQIIANMKNKTADDVFMKTKMFMYSAHDTTVAALLSALALYDGKSPQYTATVIVELHEKPQKQFYVNLYYKNVTDDSSVYQLTLPNCATDCPLDDFVRLTKDAVPTDWLKQCASPVNSSHEMLATGWIVAIALGCVLVVFVVVTVICFIRLRRRNDATFYGKFDVSS